MRLTRLKEWRETQGLTQKELADASDISEFTVLRAEHRGETRPNTARRFADVLGVSVGDLIEKPPVPLEMPVPLGGASDTGPRDEPLISRPEVREWLLRQGHVPREDFPYLARELSSEEEIDGAIGELHETRDRILQLLEDRDVRDALFGRARPKRFTGEDRIGEVFRPGKLAWKLGWEIRSEYLARETALVNYGRELFVKGEAEDYLVRGPVGEHDHERHELMLEERRRVLEEKYAAQLAAV
jgi:transcriptional regulator with XRE-family HTH domain